MNPPERSSATDIPRHDPLKDLTVLASPSQTAEAKPFVPAPNFLVAYGLKRNPFSDAVDPSFYFQTTAHTDAIKRMHLAIDHDVSLAMITGPSGTGKTLLTQLLLAQVDNSHCEPVLVLVTPGLSKTGMLREILSELNIALPTGINRTQELLRLLSNCVIDLYRENRKLLLIFDECHFLSADNLHLIRTISNIEIPERKLSTCLLFGESRFAKRLEHQSYESLRNRMFFRCRLEPMTCDETAQYTKFRLMTAGRLHPLFTEGGLTAMYEQSGGIGRQVNQIGMLSLVEGFQIGSPVIDSELVNACADAR